MLHLKMKQKICDFFGQYYFAGERMIINFFFSCSIGGYRVDL